MEHENDNNEIESDDSSEDQLVSDRIKKIINSLWVHVKDLS